jgi:hypothetical protein
MTNSRRRLRLAELRSRWEAAEQRAATATRGGPEWEAARAEGDELEAMYMARLNRILERAADRGWGRPPGF